MAQSDGKMRLCLFWFTPGSHPGGWRMPNAKRGAGLRFSDLVDIARRAEDGKLDAIFFADALTVPTVDLIEAGARNAGQMQRHAAGLEPTTLLPALATATRRLGLIATATTTYNEPYHIARRFASIDHISDGRAGWNLVTSQTESEAQNFGFDEHLAHDDRYDRASEFFDVVTGLWDSWDDGELSEDKDTAEYFDASRVHVLNHVGKHFRVRGPLNVVRAPQGRPVIVQAGASGPGKALAARIADCVFTAQSDIDEAKAFHDELKSMVAANGRDPDQVRIMPGLMPIIGETDEDAERIADELRAGITDDAALRSLHRISGGLDLREFPLDGPLPELPETNGAQARQKMLIDMARKHDLTLIQAARRFAEGQAHLVITGSAATIADRMEEWFRAGACDGFNLMPTYFPDGLDDIIDRLVPELQSRGLFRTEYEGATLRENLGLEQPQSRYATVPQGTDAADAAQ